MNDHKKKSYWISYEEWKLGKEWIAEKQANLFWEMTGWLGHPPKKKGKQLILLPPFLAR